MIVETTENCIGKLEVARDYPLGEMVVPYQLNKDLLPPDILGRVYDDFEKEDLMPELCHERKTPKNQFIEFLETKTLCSIFVNLKENRYAGIAWLSEIADLDSHNRAIGAYCFLKSHWDIKRSLIYGKLCLAHWFFPRQFEMDSDGLDSLWGVTPEPNRLARLYSARLGFRYVANLPGFTCYHGQRCNGLVCRMEREEFQQRWNLFQEV